MMEIVLCGNFFNKYSQPKSKTRRGRVLVYNFEVCFYKIFKFFFLKSLILSSEKNENIL